MYVDNIYEASNGQDALDIFNKKKPQIIISDVKMPIMDGLMLTTMIRNINNNVPIVIVSGYSDRDMLLDFTLFESCGVYGQAHRFPAV